MPSLPSVFLRLLSQGLTICSSDCPWAWCDLPASASKCWHLQRRAATISLRVCSRALSPLSVLRHHHRVNNPSITCPHCHDTLHDLRSQSQGLRWTWTEAMVTSSFVYMGSSVTATQGWHTQLLSPSCLWQRVDGSSDAIELWAEAAGGSGTHYISQRQLSRIPRHSPF